MWSAACGQAAEDLEFLSHLPRRRREAPLELGVLARPLLEVRRAGPRARLGLGLEGVLLAGVLRCFYGFVASGGSLWRRRAGFRIENSRRASGALAASRDVFVSLEGFRAFRARAAIWQPWWLFRTPAAPGGRVTGRVLASGYDTEISQAAPSAPGPAPAVYIRPPIWIGSAS